MIDRVARWRVGRWRREAADRHAEMLHDTLRMILDAGPPLPPDLHHHACQVLAATARRERDRIGGNRS